MARRRKGRGRLTIIERLGEARKEVEPYIKRFEAEASRPYMRIPAEVLLAGLLAVLDQPSQEA